MIKRVLAFVALLVLGFATLYFVSGDDSLARLGSGTEKIKKPTADRETSSEQRVVMPLSEGQNSIAGEVEVGYTGEFRVAPPRDVPLPDGRILQLPIYEIYAANSVPIRDGRQELTDVRVEFFEIRDDRDEPYTVSAAVLIADTARIALGRDDKGASSVAKDKDIDLLGAVLTTGPESRVENLELRIEHATVRITDDWMRLATVRDDDPVTLELAHEQGPLNLTGKGLKGRFPVHRPSEESSADDARIEVEILQQPLLVHGGTAGESRLSATGPLRYVEDQRTGLASITVDGDVEIEGRGLLAAGEDDGGAGTEPLVAFGDHLEATLRRGADSAGDSPRVLWRDVYLAGSEQRRAGLRGQGMNLACDDISITPSLRGEPWLITANGTPALRQEVDGQTLQFEAAERIHLIRLQAHLEPWLAGRGWGRTIASAQPTQLLVFTGKSLLTLPGEESELVLASENGLRVLRGDDADAPFSVLGLGAVDLTSIEADTRLTVKGNHGFALHSGAEGQDLRLGPADISDKHRFEVQSGELTARGTGRCRLFRPLSPEQPGRITLESPSDDLSFTLASGGSLHGAAHLQASFDRAGIQSFRARGPACRIDWADETQRVEGLATEIVSSSPSSFELRGTPARVVSDRGTLDGKTIYIERLDDEHTMLVARGGAHLVGTELFENERAKGQLELDAETIAYLPVLRDADRPRSSLPWSAELPALDPSVPTLVAEVGVEVRNFDEDGEAMDSARGDTLVLQLGDDTVGCLRGEPATLARTDAAGQNISGTAPEILLRGAKAEQASLHPRGEQYPTISIANRKGEMRDFGVEGGHTEIVCHGVIELDGEDIGFGAPVEVTSRLRDGSIDPNGFHLDTQSMRMLRDRDTGEVAQILAGQGTHLRWRSIEATAWELSLDLATHVGTAVSGPDDPARVWSPRFRGTCSRAEFNYLTYEVEAWHVVGEGERAKE